MLQGGTVMKIKWLGHACFLLTSDNGIRVVTLCESNVLAEDKLFATLDPTTRSFRLSDGREALLIDTVGFIRSSLMSWWRRSSQLLKRQCMRTC